MSKIIGIDLGTTNSCMACIEGGEPSIIPNEQGERTTPSVVALARNNERLVGQFAKRQAVTNPDNTVHSVKRFMGRKYPDAGEEIKGMNFEIIRGRNDEILMDLGGSRNRPEEISAMILRSLKRDAEEFLSDEVKEAVITVPAYFNDAQRQATKDAGRIAGLDVLRIINEPTAAAMSSGFDMDRTGKVAVYDLGGGTFDISILELSEGVYQVKSTNGDTMLGGDDFDRLIARWILDRFMELEGIDLSGDRMAMQRIMEASEKAKCELSSVHQTNINLPFIYADNDGPRHLEVTLDRAALEKLILPLIRKTLEPCRKALEDAGLGRDDVDEVVLVGGSTRIPAVKREVSALFNCEIRRGINPDEVVAMGAAVQAGILSGDIDEVILLDVTPLSLGIETLGGVMTTLIERNTTIPCSKKQVFSTATDNQPAVSIHVLQGERELAEDNTTLTRFDLVGIPPAERGIPQIEVRFDIDVNGIVHVSARDLGTGKEQKMEVKVASGLTDDQIDSIVEEARKYAGADKEKKEKIKVRNEARILINSTEKTLAEFGGDMDPQKRSEIESALEELLKLADSENFDAEAARRVTGDLSRKVYRATEEMYQSAAEKDGSGDK
ncbi:MAG: molecular chaperone DnaK [Candidatus Krumholzibacteriales bacterium]